MHYGTNHYTNASLQCRKTWKKYFKNQRKENCVDKKDKRGPSLKHDTSRFGMPPKQNKYTIYKLKQEFSWKSDNFTVFICTDFF